MTAPIHQEIVFEDEICNHLQGHGWVFDGPLPYKNGHQYDAGYDRRYALFPVDAICWVKKTQKDAWDKFTAHHKDEAESEREFIRTLTSELDRERKTIKKDDPQLWGSLHVLRRGFKHINASFKMATFAPANSLNPKLWDEYQNNILRVVRQVHYSMHNEKCIDLVLFLNGLPIATIELKTETTQSIEAAMRQYRKDRNPIDSGSNSEEPLLSFGKRALVHFAVSSDEVRMSTKLNGDKTFFLPFNKGIDDGLGGAGAGNPPDHLRGHATAYFWHEILEPKMFLDIIGKFISVEVKAKVNQKSSKKTFTPTLLFPRFHQLDAVNTLLAATLQEGVGQAYLVQHSAGSGKSNTIGWSAHRLSTLFDAENHKLFTTVIVITDRKVLDQQLQDTIKQFEATPGVVVKIDDNSTQLAEALEGEAKIIVTTIQKFPHVLNKIGAMKGRRFAVIIDEAHSSQSGKTAVKLREALTNDGFKIDADDLSDGDEAKEVNSEDLVAKLVSSRKRPPNVSYYAFTATPKAKTIELFGRKGDDGLPRAFHVYSMRQAIEEGFILDVLKGYVTYDMAFKLEQAGADIDVKSVKAQKKLFQYVQLHPTSIGQKIALIVEHFRKHVMHMLNGEAKAMVVTDSRKAAVRYKMEFDKYMDRMGYHDFKALVAYSGTITDPEYGIEDADEGDMNGGKPKIKDDLIKEAFLTDEYRVLLVANKFQVGFDEPRLCAMYVDKRLDNVMAVQTLSRLNRIFPGKEMVCVIDFRNKSKDILAAFQPYYRTAKLSGITNPNLPHQLREKLDQTGVYLWEEVEAFSLKYFSTRNDQAFQSHLKQAHERFKALKEEEQELFRRDAQSYVTAYDFLSQILDFESIEMEKLHGFLKMLLPRLHGREDDPILLDKAIRLSQYKLLNKQETKMNLATGKAEELKPLGLGGGIAHDDPRMKLSEIIKKIHSLFTGKHSDPEIEGWFTSVIGNTSDSEQVVMEAKANSTLEQFANGSVKAIMLESIKSSYLSHKSMATQVLQDTKVFENLVDILLPEIYQRAKNGGAASTGL
jgi:type I restriction enzyme, R subunit